MTTPTERARAEAKLGDGRVICDECGATLRSYLDGSRCTAPLDVRCPGFEAVEDAMRP